MKRDKHRVVIIGGGFGGLYAARHFNKAPVEVTLVDRKNYHLFQPLLYQVATGALSPGDIASPLRMILKRQENTRVIMAEAIGFDTERRQVLLSDGELPYDFLVVAAGSSHHYFGNDSWGEHAPGLKTIEDATEIRRRVLLAFEAAERETDQEKIKAWLTFVVVGGGPTGVELVGALGEIARETLRRDFRHINPADAKIILLEGSRRILSAYPEKLSLKARQSLARLGVIIRDKTIATEIYPDRLVFTSGGKEERLATRTVLWAAGVISSPLGARLAEAVGAQTDKTGRLAVNPDLSLPGHPNIHVIGDMAHVTGRDGKTLPGVAQVAMQQGKYVARTVLRKMRGKTVKPFHYRDFGSMATIGRSSAVADLRWLRLSGFLGWLAWLFVHIMYIVEFQSRLLVFVQWAWNYFTRGRSTRLITGPSPLPLFKGRIQAVAGSGDKSKSDRAERTGVSGITWR